MLAMSFGPCGCLNFTLLRWDYSTLQGGFTWSAQQTVAFPFSEIAFCNALGNWHLGATPQAKESHVLGAISLENTTKEVETEHILSQHSHLIFWTIERVPMLQ